MPYLSMIRSVMRSRRDNHNKINRTDPIIALFVCNTIARDSDSSNMNRNSRYDFSISDKFCYCRLRVLLSDMPTSSHVYNEQS